LELNRHGLGLERSGVVPGARVLPGFRALVALGAAELVGLGVEEGVQGVLDAAAHDGVDVAANLIAIDLQGFAKVVWNRFSRIIRVFRRWSSFWELLPTGYRTIEDYLSWNVRNVAYLIRRCGYACERLAPSIAYAKF
jgi:hypothetical protein